ncbi:DUF3887 domain-containing protein [Spirulina sp. CS-785/01]|uniref:DUF3887 domain-containing protein n=1 Tax=Spirulina sp. CS-785/01 TaxID=3021716 RepID=UPI00232C3AFD|nr:DUF3887 domain-containing protein [Spirulina sp. CS-785/01]MDB9313927.1 DUF3887 domain-containing protein [Spirulina sp. CS-785/01]
MTKFFRLTLSAVALTAGLFVSVATQAKPPETHSPLEMAQTPEDRLTNEKIAEGFLEAMEAEQYNIAWANLHPNLQQAWNLQRMQEIWADVEASLGEYQGYQRSREAENVVAVTVEFENITDDLIFVFENNKIAGIDFPQETWDMIGD